MAKLAGIWVLGDEKDLVYTVKNVDGTARDLTGDTVTLEGRRYKDVLLAINKTGVVDPDQVTNKGKVTFSNITTGISLGTARHQVFECRVHVTHTGDELYTNPFDVVVEAWP